MQCVTIQLQEEPYIECKPLTLALDEINIIEDRNQSRATEKCQPLAAKIEIIYLASQVNQYWEGSQD